MYLVFVALLNYTYGLRFGHILLFLSIVVNSCRLLFLIRDKKCICYEVSCLFAFFKNIYHQTLKSIGKSAFSANFPMLFYHSNNYSALFFSSANLLSISVCMRSTTSAYSSFCKCLVLPIIDSQSITGIFLPVFSGS